MARRSPYMGVDVSGVRTLARGMRDVGHDLGDLRALNLRVAEVVWRDALARAPEESGDLRVSLTTGATRFRARVRSRLPYGNAIHYGRQAGAPTLPPAGRNISRPWFIQPDPFITEAARATERRWVDIYRDGIQALLDRVAAATYPGSP